MINIATRNAESLSESRVDGASRLLVSVRDAGEALLAAEGGAAFIDVKEPKSGSLGRASREVQVEVVTALQASLDAGRSVTLTAALGELSNSGSPESYAPVPGLSLYKLGLSDCGGSRDWVAGLDAWRERVTVQPADLVAVSYADHEAARAPELCDVLDYAIDRRLPFLLIDTFDKGAGSLSDFLCDGDIAILLAEAHRHEVAVALAGSLRLEDVVRMAPMGPDVVAVRGAACRDGKRELGLDPGRIRALAESLRRS